MFFCEFWEISHKTFFKERFERLLLHKHSFCLLSQHNFDLFKNDVTHISWASIFSAEFAEWEQEWTQYFKSLARSLFLFLTQSRSIFCENS